MMQYFVMLENQETLPVTVKSVSPSGAYFIGFHAETPATFYVYRVLKTENQAIYGQKVVSCPNFSDFNDMPTFNGIAWFEEYGFVKFIFTPWGEFESECYRRYFDRELYERKKKELHGQKR